MLVAVLLVATWAPQANAQDLKLDLCNSFNKLINNPLLGDLDEEFKSFISLLNPDRADINGKFDINDSGDSLSVQLEGDLMKDVTSQMGAMMRIGNRPADFPVGGSTVYSNADVAAAWNANKAQIRADLGKPVTDLTDLVLPTIVDVLTAYVTIGGGSAIIESDDPVVLHGEGAFGFVQALFTFLNQLLKNLGDGTLTVANQHIQPDNYIQLTEFLADGDLDGDGFSNLCESFHFRQTTCTTKGESDPTIGYPAAATDPNIVPIGCFLEVDICNVVLNQDNVVDGPGNDSVGQAAIRLLRNDVTGEERYRLDSVYATGFPVGYEFRRGAPGETGETLFALDTTLPVTFILTPEQIAQIQAGPTYIVVLRKEGEAPIEVAIRGNIDACPFLQEPPVYHSADTNKNYKIERNEIEAVVAFLDPPNNGAYQCDGSGGYIPGSGSEDCDLHDSDFITEDFRIDVPEFLRLSQFFNADGYAPCDDAPDGFCPFFN